MILVCDFYKKYVICLRRSLRVNDKFVKNYIQIQVQNTLGLILCSSKPATIQTRKKSIKNNEYSNGCMIKVVLEKSCLVTNFKPGADKK